MSYNDKILKKLNELFPYHNGEPFTYSFIRATVARYGEIFIYERLKRSKYGLRCWEHEGEIKGGSIRDIVSEFLAKQGKPCQITKITKYIFKFRKNTNAKSILYNLKLDTKNRFAFYEGTNIGLSESHQKSLESGYKLTTIEELINNIFDYD